MCLSRLRCRARNPTRYLCSLNAKDSSNTIPVNDLEEFWAKIEQVAGANVKGVVASTAAFQEGALRYAESKGFGVLRHFGQDDFKWVLSGQPRGPGQTARRRCEKCDGP